MIKLYVLYGGDIICRDATWLNKDLELKGEVALANPVFLIHHPKGRILWDTGLSDKLIDKSHGIESWIFHLNMKKRLIDQLSELELSPQEIDYLAFSHTHLDHTGNAGYFASSTLIMQEKEYALSFESENKLSNYEDIEPLKNSKTLKLNGDFDLFGDGSIVFISTPGHTVGHQSLLLRLSNTGTIVISGDVTYYEESFLQMGVPKFNHDEANSISSILKLQTFVKEENAQLWIQHDKEQFSRFRLSPEFYD